VFLLDAVHFYDLWRLNSYAEHNVNRRYNIRYSYRPPTAVRIITSYL